MSTLTNHELNEQAAEAVGRIWKGAILHMHPDFVYYVVEGKDEDGEVEFIDWCFSPATSIKDAMDLLPLLPDDRRVTAEYGPNDVRVYSHPADHEFVSDPRIVKYGNLAREFTEAFVAAMEASDAK